VGGGVKGEGVRHIVGGVGVGIGTRH
jgi:hypothetical protein